MRWLKPHVETVPIQGSDADVVGVMQRSNFKPWYSEQDASNVMFVSVHGYGPRERGLEHLFPRAAFYPGSGKTSLPVVPPPSPRTEATVAAASVWSSAPTGAARQTTSSSASEASKPRSVHMQVDDNDDEEEAGDGDEQPLSRDGSDDSVDGDDEVEEGEGEGEGDGDEEESMLERLQAMEGEAGGGAYGRLLAARRTLGSFAPLTGSRAVDNAAAAVAADPRLVAGGMPALILDIGVELPDGEAEHDRGKALAELNYRIQWRKYFRNEIFPRLMQFKPDFLFISAGFDAHKKDTINGGYIALVINHYTFNYFCFRAFLTYLYHCYLLRRFV